MKLLFKFLGLLFCILFAWGAYVQFNDPDATLWIIIYIIAAAGALLFFFDKLRRTIAWLIVIACLVGSFYNWPENYEGLSMVSDTVNKEKGRESVGLLIIAGVFLIFGLRLGSSRKL